MQVLPRGEARRQEDGKLNIRQSVLLGKEQEQFSLTFLPDQVILKGGFILADADAKRLSRFLAKCGLETLCLKRGMMAFGDEFDPLRTYARWGTRPDFVPFLWGPQNETPCDLLLATMKIKGIEGAFYFATVSVPGSVYFVPLNRLGEFIAIEKLEARYPLKKIMQPGLLKREPIRYEVRSGGNS